MCTTALPTAAPAARAIWCQIWDAIGVILELVEIWSSFTYWGQTLASWPDGRQFSHSTYMLFFGDEPKIPLTLRLSSNGLTSPYFAYKSREGREEVRTEFSRDFEQTSSVLLIQCISDYYALDLKWSFSLSFYHAISYKSCTAVSCVVLKQFVVCL